MAGQFTFFVASGVPTKEVSICSVGVFGTRYIRAFDPPSSITLDASQKVLTVNHVYAEDDISDILAINLRQKPSAELSWVTIFNSLTSADVTINAKGVPTGEYSLVLESVDTNSSLPTLVLKTDRVSIYVTEYFRDQAVQSFIEIKSG